MFHGYAATEPGGALSLIEFEPAPLGTDDVEIQVEYCGICHSDLSMMRNEWGMTTYPFVGGHEVAGRIVELGDGVEGLQ